MVIIPFRYTTFTISVHFSSYSRVEWNQKLNHVTFPILVPALRLTHISDFCEFPPQFLREDWVLVGRVIVQDETAGVNHVGH